MSGDYPYASPPDAKTWQADWPREYAPPAEPAFVPTLALIVAGIMLVLSSGNVLMVPIADSLGPWRLGTLGIAWVMSIAGSIGAQAALLTILVGFGTGKLWQRLCWHWTLAAMAGAAWCLGFAMVEWNWISSSRFDGQELLTAVCAMPLLAACCQAAPWLLRAYSRWRIQRLPADALSVEKPGHSPFVESADSRLTIRDVLAGTVVAAVSLAAARLGKPPLVGDAEYWAVVLSLCGAAAVVVAVGALPIVYLVLGTRCWRRGGAGVLVIAVTAATTIAGILLCVPGGPTGIEKIAMAVSLVGGFVGPLAGTLLLARMYGYRLVRS